MLLAQGDQSLVEACRHPVLGKDVEGEGAQRVQLGALARQLLLGTVEAVRSRVTRCRLRSSRSCRSAASGAARLCSFMARQT